MSGNFRWISPLVVVLLVAASCSSTSQLADREEAPDGVAETSPKDTRTSEPECTTERVVDEYDFIAVIEICGGVEVDVPIFKIEDSLASLEALPGTQVARVLAHGVRDRLVLQTGCREPGDSPANIELAIPGEVGIAVRRIPDADAQQLLIDGFAAITEADTYCNGDVTSWSSATRNALVAFDEFAVALGEPPLGRTLARTVPGATDDGLTALSADVTTTYDRLFTALALVGGVHASDLWFSSSHLAHVDGLRRDIANGLAPTAVLIGSSVIARAADPSVTTELSPMDDLVSFALAGATHPVHIAMANEARRIAPSITSIVWGLSTNPFHDQACPSEDAEEIERVLAVQHAAFDPIVDLSERSTQERLLGSLGSKARYGPTRLQASATNLHGDWDRGEMIPFDGRDEERITIQSEGLAARYRQPKLCTAFFDDIERAIRSWTAEGVEVVLFAAPIPDALVNFHPDGRVGHDAVVTQLKDLAERADSTFHDFSDLIEDERFFDLTHVNAIGRRLFSEQLGETLAAR